LLSPAVLIKDEGIYDLSLYDTEMPNAGYQLNGFWQENLCKTMVLKLLEKAKELNRQGADISF